MTSLNPTRTIGSQLREAYRIHRPGTSVAEANRRAEEVLSLVRMPRPKERLRDYPHQLSGGMRQRAMIAIALLCEPRLLIADEPTTALDVSIQAQILELLDELKNRLGMGIILVTHDLGVIAGHADKVAVMYGGRIVEEAPAAELYRDSLHPYSEGLLRSFPPLRGPRRELTGIPGSPPDLRAMPSGCSFHPRCPHAFDRCVTTSPVLGRPQDRAGSARTVACWLHPAPDTTGQSTPDPVLTTH
jgi:oligopeptide/dipeptide ABC transporter ATP-binding protein